MRNKTELKTLPWGNLQWEKGGDSSIDDNKFTACVEEVRDPGMKVTYAAGGEFGKHPWMPDYRMPNICPGKRF